VTHSHIRDMFPAISGMERAGLVSNRIKERGLQVPLSTSSAVTGLFSGVQYSNRKSYEDESMDLNLPLGCSALQPMGGGACRELWHGECMGTALKSSRNTCHNPHLSSAIDCWGWKVEVGVSQPSLGTTLNLLVLLNPLWTDSPIEPHLHGPAHSQTARNPNQPN
jgi:hypothetical protein